ncbi:site-specific integrase [Clostridium felsineum]|uniref:site-specific integrase n=1 Tax=Clostridium felsineum TaxID=36839 RepID=UPI00214D5CCF|nr:site-specific integrase [Clostridium felsineum]MCR3759212.1 site-specific integrase [Clostridium felsineum]
MPVYKNEKRKTYYCAFYYQDWTGERKKKKKEGFKKRSEAQQWEREFLAKQQNNADMNFGTLVKLYMEDVETRVRYTTFQGKKYIVNLKILPYFENMNIVDITPNHIRKWQNILKKKGFTQSYLKTINIQLSAIFNFAIKYYNLKSSPALKAGSMGKKGVNTMQFWTLKEFKKFIKCDDKPISNLAFKILFWTGMRSGELIALTWEDINLNDKTINISKTYTRLNGKDIINEPKTPKSKRIISISDHLCKDIKTYKEKLYKIKESDRLFNFTKFFLPYQMERVCKISGVKKIRIHDLRHSHASLLIELGFSPLLISERLGHEKIQTTLNTYSHLYPNKQNVLAKKLDDLY